MAAENSTTAEDVEVLPPDNSACVPRIRFNLGTTLQSPFFWLLLGVGVGVGVSYYFTRARR